MPQVADVLAKMRQFSEAVRSGKWRGYSGKRITDVVNIGIGGSDLGPVMVTEALRPFTAGAPRLHFVSNVDSSQISDVLASLDPRTTLFIVVSKSFTTPETQINANTARDWMLLHAPGPEVLSGHVVAVTNNVDAAKEFGIDPRNVFPMWDWVGGRYSLWSAVGLSIAVAIGMDEFESMLYGAYEMDEHFRHAPVKENLPITLALLGVWYNNFFNCHAHAVLPYDQRLQRLPAYLQQADMESNGKSVDRDGHQVDYATGPVIFGEPGINGQHAFYQLLHQGTPVIPADMIVPIESYPTIETHQRMLVASAFAQAEAMMRGKTEDEARAELAAEGLRGDALEQLLPYKVFPGNRPTNTLMYTSLTPNTLGRLIALYEHKIFVQGVIWNINSFDQWGVELGKQLAKQILPELDDDRPVTDHDSSTNGLINYYKKNRTKG
jgi:glucose-6-phosphate isomerase